MVQQSTPAPDEGFHDLMAGKLEDFFGGTNHYGYWEDDDPDTEDYLSASKRLTLRVGKELAPTPGARILDIGCGTGKPAMQIVAAHNVHVTGIGISEREIEQAQEGLSKGNANPDQLTFQLADVMDLPFDDAFFDGAFAIESLCFVRDKAAAFAQVARILRPGGRLTIADFYARETEFSIPKPTTAATDAEAEARARMEHLFRCPPLITPNDCENLLHQAGFRIVAHLNITRKVSKSMGALLPFVSKEHPGLNAVEKEYIDEVLAAIKHRAKDFDSISYNLITAERL